MCLVDSWLKITVSGSSRPVQSPALMWRRWAVRKHLLISLNMLTYVLAWLWMFLSVIPVFGTWHPTEVQQETGEPHRTDVVEPLNESVVRVSLRPSLLVCVSSVRRVRLAGRWKSQAALRRSLPNVFFSRGDVAPRSPYKNTSVLTGEKYKKQVFCLNLVDSIVKFLQILKVKLKLLVLSLYAFAPSSPEWQTIIYGFHTWS